MDAIDCREILAVLNAWADADLARVRAIHAELTAQVLLRLPPVLPRRRTEARHARRTGRALPGTLPDPVVRKRYRCFVCGEPGHYRNRCPQRIGLSDEV